ncbi:sodium-independent sulfate anion transporter-like [Choristoneura fumiferana]|uniref:sodium-independent sulfate anion transporter-like n=1 Tax=Choristoneura fumiferana TaxID=7141 RepID=UPI003D158862
MTVLPVNFDENTNTVRKRRNCSKDLCSVKSVKKRLPIIEWLPTYNSTKLIQDIIAGITVGLTAIPQGIAYAIVAGLSPEYGLYAGLMGGFVYLIFGSCKDVTVGPTAIMAAMVSKYVSNYSADFAVLAAFLAGLIELGMGVLQLGFLVEFISMPVISGFTTAAALQIASAQLKSLFGLEGKSGNYFAESIYNFVLNITTMKLWDPILGFITIGILIYLKRLGQGCSRTDGIVKQLRWFISLGRNAVVVVLGMIIAYVLKLTTDGEPLVLIGDIGSGIPKIAPPPFTTTVGNQTYSFGEMLQVLGPQSIVLPLVAILETVAIAKAFAGGKSVDATQEMVAVGICNIIGSMVRSMPVTGSFTRTALNNASGVQTPAGGIFTGLLILLALTLLTSTFYFIPKASLAGLIITAMFSMIDFAIFGRLWRNNKIELLFLLVTMSVSMCMGLEYGIVSGIIVEAATLLYFTSRPKLEVTTVIGEKGGIITIPLNDRLSYCAAEHIRRTVLRACRDSATNNTIIIDGANVKTMDSTVASNLVSVAQDLDKSSRKIIFLNFSNDIVKLCLDINPKLINRFTIASKAEDLYDLCQKS